MDMSLLISIAVGFVGIIIGVIATVIYGSNYLPKRKGKAKEKYMVTDIYDFRVKTGTHHLARIQLIRSSIKNSCGFADLIINPTGVEFLHYAFANNCFHDIIAPSTILIDDSVDKMKAQSNEFSSISIVKNESDISTEFIPKKFRKKAIECMLLSISFEFPKTYTGPLYKSKRLLFAKGIGLLKAVTTYMNNQEDVFELTKCRIRKASQSWWPVEQSGNYWVYRIQYAFGPNRVNIQAAEQGVPADHLRSG